MLWVRDLHDLVLGKTAVGGGLHGTQIEANYLRFRAKCAGGGRLLPLSVGFTAKGPGLG